MLPLCRPDTHTEPPLIASRHRSEPIIPAPTLRQDVRSQYWYFCGHRPRKRRKEFSHLPGLGTVRVRSKNIRSWSYFVDEKTWFHCRIRTDFRSPVGQKGSAATSAPTCSAVSVRTSHMPPAGTLPSVSTRGPAASMLFAFFLRNSR